MSVADLSQLTIQPILTERLERFAAKHGLSMGEAIERLVRVGLFTEAAPNGATLIRRGDLAEWRSLKAEVKREPWNRGGPDQGEPDVGDVLF